MTDRRALVLALALAVLSCKRAAPPPAAPTVPPSVETDEQILSRRAKSDGVKIGREIMSKKLLAPTQATFSDGVILDQVDNFVYVATTVDAPNTFGVMLRQRWCALVRFDPPRGEGFHWHAATGAWQCEENAPIKDLLIRKVAISWPGASVELTGALVGEKRREGTLRWINRLAKDGDLDVADMHVWFNQLLIAGVTSEQLDAYFSAALDVSVGYDDRDKGISVAVLALSDTVSNQHPTEDDAHALHLRHFRPRMSPSDVLRDIAGKDQLGGKFVAAQEARAKAQVP